MKKGFTLIELIIVIVIIGILAAIALPRIFVNIENARRAEAMATMRSIADALRAYAASRDGSVIDKSFPIEVDFDSDATLEYNMISPVSTNFNYVITGDNLNNAMVQAQKKNQAQFNYCLCVSSGKTGKHASSVACGITCP